MRKVQSAQACVVWSELAPVSNTTSISAIYHCYAPEAVDAVCQAKADTFAALSQVLRESGIEFAWCRLFYLFGEGEDARRLVPYLRAKLRRGEPVELSSGTQIRDFLDVRDAGRMIADAALGSMQGPVNICSGKPITVRQIAEKIADEYGRRDLLRFGARPEIGRSTVRRRRRRRRRRRLNFGLVNPC